MINFNSFKVLIVSTLCLIFLNSCGKNFFKAGDARVISPDPRERVKKNLEEEKDLGLMMLLKEL